MAPKVELRGLSMRYFSLEGETEALKDISFSVAAGEFVAIIGQSGCGKSTLLSLISGILKPTAGITPEEVGNATVFLCSPLASAITGHVLYVDCGYNIMGF